MRSTIVSVNAGDGELLHIGVQNAIRNKLIHFPHHTDRYGKTEGEHRNKRGTEIKGNTIGTVEQTDDRKTERTEHSAAERVQHRVPVGNQIVKTTHFAQIDGTIQKGSIHDHHFGRYDQTKSAMQKTRQQHCQNTDNAL